jgi:hypothetical protein
MQSLLKRDMKSKGNIQYTHSRHITKNCLLRKRSNPNTRQAITWERRKPHRAISKMQYSKEEANLSIQTQQRSSLSRRKHKEEEQKNIGTPTGHRHCKINQPPRSSNRNPNCFHKIISHKFIRNNFREEQDTRVVK